MLGGRTISLNRIWRIFLGVVVIANSGYMLMMTGGTAALVIEALTDFAAIICAVKLVGKTPLFHTKLNQMSGLVLVLFCFLFATFATSADGPLPYIRMASIVIIAYYIVASTDSAQLISMATKILTAISLIAFCFYAYIHFVGFPPPISILKTYVGYADYYNYGIFFYPQLHNALGGRLQALFWEPGVYAGLILLVVSADILINKTTNWKCHLVLAVALFLTASTAGFVLVLIPIVLLLLDRAKSDEAAFLVVVALVAIIVFSAFSMSEILRYLAELNPQMFSKLLIQDNDLSLTRLLSPYIDIIAFSEKPIFGWGLNASTQRYIELALVYGADSQTSTTGYYLASLGMFGGLLSMYAAVLIITMRNFALPKKILILVLVSILFNIEPYGSLIVPWIVLALVQKNHYENRLRFSKVSGG